MNVYFCHFGSNDYWVKMKKSLPQRLLGLIWNRVYAGVTSVSMINIAITFSKTSDVKVLINFARKSRN